MKLPRRLLRATVLAALFTTWPTLVVAQSEPAGEQSPSEQAEKLLREAAALAKKDDWSGALPLLERSFQLVPASETAANLGQAAYRLGEFAEAARYLSFALRTLSPSIPATKRKAIEKMRDSAKKEVAEVNLVVQPQDAEVFVDGESRGSDLRDPLFLAPGDHTIGVRAEGYGAAKKIVTAKKGERADVDIALVREASSAAGAGGADGGGGGTTTAGGSDGDAGASDTTHGEERSMVPVYVAGGVAVVGLGAALGFELGRSSNADDAETTLGRLGPKGCASGTPYTTECSAIHDSNVAAHRDADLRNVSLGIAGAAVVFGIGYLLWPQAGGETAARRTWISVTPLVSQERGISVAGSF